MHQAGRRSPKSVYRQLQKCGIYGLCIGYTDTKSRIEVKEEEKRKERDYTDTEFTTFLPVQVLTDVGKDWRLY